MKAISIFFVDDYTSVRESLAFLLEPKGIPACGDTGTCAETLAGVGKHHPDMVLVDLFPGDADRRTLIADLDKRGFPSLACSIHEDESHARTMCQICCTHFSCPKGD